MKQARWVELIFGILACAVGIMINILPTDTFPDIIKYSGIALIVIGVVINIIVLLVHKTWKTALHIVIGLILIIAGVFCLMKKDLIISNITIGCGVMMIITAVIVLQRLIEISSIKHHLAIKTLVTFLINVLLAALIIISPFDHNRWMYMLSGIAMVIFGLVNMILTIYVMTISPIQEQKENND